MTTETQKETALVTGARQGIGRATAKRLAADGYMVAVNDLDDTPELRALAHETGGVLAVADVGSPSQVAEMVRAVTDALGHIDVLVSNAAFMTMEPFPPTDWDIWWQNLDTNLNGTFLLLREILPQMTERGEGRIVIMASETGVIGTPNATAYGASKTGLIALTRSIALEYGPCGIRANAIAPGFVDTPQLQVDALDAGVSLDEIRARYSSLVPVGRIGQPEDIAATVSFLVSGSASGLNGSVIQPGGGTTRSRA